MSRQFDHPEDLLPLGNGKRRAALPRDPLDDHARGIRERPPLVVDVLLDRVGRSLADLVAIQVDAAHPRLRAERNEPRPQPSDVDLAQPELRLRQDDDAPPFGGFVGERGELRRLGDTLGVDPVDGEKRHGLAVPQGDRSRLVQHEDVHVPRRLHGLARHRHHVRLQQAVHSGDADGREKASDRGRDETDQERSEDGYRDRRAPAGARRCVDREGQESPAGDQEDDRHRREEDCEGDLVRGLPPARPLDHRDHPVEERFARIRRHTDDDPIGQHAGSPRHCASITAALPDDRGALARNRALVDRGDPLDHVAVRGDEFPGFDENDVVLPEVGGRDLRRGGILVGGIEFAGDQIPSRAAQRFGLRAAAPLRDRLGEVREENREPEPDGDGEDESRRFLPLPRKRGDVEPRGHQTSDPDDEHHRIAHLAPGIQLHERLADGALQDVASDAGAPLWTRAHTVTPSGLMSEAEGLRRSGQAPGREGTSARRRSARSRPAAGRRSDCASAESPLRRESVFSRRATPPARGWGR